MKSLWITSLVKDKSVVNDLTQQAARYGLEARGHFWEDNVKKMAWLAVYEQLKDTSIHLWVILLSREVLTPDVRYALTLLTLTIKNERPDLPVLLLDPALKMEKSALPGIFADFPFIREKGAVVGVKFTAMANMPAKQHVPPYYLTVHANPGFGVWFEVGPSPGQQWHGAIFGVHQGEIKAHGFGERGTLPERCVLEYPIKGMQLESGGVVYQAWGIQNKLIESTSYFVKVDSTVSSFLFGPLPTDQQADLHLIYN